jgi:hypothetical protein
MASFWRGLLGKRIKVPIDKRQHEELSIRKFVLNRISESIEQQVDWCDVVRVQGSSNEGLDR